MEGSQEFPISPLALLFPEMDPEELARLTDSIRQHGQLEPIGVLRDEILDGRHRLAACAEAGVEPEFRHLPDDTDPLAYILAKNADRRHLNESQRAVIAFKLSAGAGPGRPRSGEDNCVHIRKYSQGDAAKLLGVSRSMLTLANRVLAEDGPAVPDLREMVERGQVRVSDAAQVLDQPQEIQRRAVALMDSEQAKNISQAVRQALLETKIQEHTAQSEAYQTMPPGDRIMIHSVPVAGLRDLVALASVDAIITQPPHSEEFLPLLADLANFAAHASGPRGCWSWWARGCSCLGCWSIWSTATLNGWRSSTYCFRRLKVIRATPTTSACNATPCWSTGNRFSTSTAGMTSLQCRHRMKITLSEGNTRMRCA